MTIRLVHDPAFMESRERSVICTLQMCAMCLNLVLYVIFALYYLSFWKRRWGIMFGLHLWAPNCENVRGGGAVVIFQRIALWACNILPASSRKQFPGLVFRLVFWEVRRHCIWMKCWTVMIGRVFWRERLSEWWYGVCVCRGFLDKATGYTGSRKATKSNGLY